MEKENLRPTLIGLVDLLFSFTFDHLINCGEVSPESPWNICKLSSQLSWLHTPGSLRECLQLNFARALTFPLYRHYEFCVRVLADVKSIVAGGKVRVLKCLLGAFDILRKHEFYYLHNNTYLKDYCLWLQNVQDKHLEKLSVALENLPAISKEDIPFPLEEFEALVDGGSEEEEESQEESSESGSSEYETDSECSESSAEGETVNERNTGKYSFGDNIGPNVSCLNEAIENMSLSEDPEPSNEGKKSLLIEVVKPSSEVEKKSLIEVIEPIQSNESASGS